MTDQNAILEDGISPRESRSSQADKLALPGLSLIVVATREIVSFSTRLEALSAQLEELDQPYEILIAPLVRGDSPLPCSGEDLADSEQMSAGTHCRVLKESAHWGDALQLALNESQFEQIGFIGDDFPPESESWKELLALTGKADLLSVECDPSSRTGLSGFCQGMEHWLARLLLGRKADSNAGMFQLFHRDALEGIRLESRSRFARTELMVSLAHQGASVVHVTKPMSQDIQDAGAFSFRDCLTSLGDLLRFWWGKQQFATQGTFPSTSLRSLLRDVSILCALAALLILPRLNLPLLEPDEGRHAEIAREMWISGDYVAPQFLGEPYLDKPPMLYWLCSVSFSLFGVHAWSARLVPAVAAWLTVLATYLFGRLLVGQRPARWGAVILLLSLGFMACARFLILESVLTLFVVTGLLTGSLATHSGLWRWKWWIASAVATGLGLLTKGPVALVLVVPPLVVHQWLLRVESPSFWRRWIVFGGLSASLALPWYVAVFIQRPEFFEYFFLHHNLDRFLSGTNHRHSMFFYIPVVLIGLLPWTLAIFPATRFLLTRNISWRARRPIGLGFLLLWSAWCLGFFTLAAGKLPYYILSCFPALALLIGYYFDQVAPMASTDPEIRQAALRVFIRRTWFVVLAAAAIAPVLFLLHLITLETAILLSLLWGGMLILLGWLHQHRTVPRFWAVYGLVALFAISELTQYGLGGWQLHRRILPDEPALLAQLRDPRTQIVCVGPHWGSVSFYLDRSDVVCLELSELDQLTSVLDPERPSLILMEHKHSVDQIEPALPSGTRLRPLTRTLRAVYLEWTADPLRPEDHRLSAAERPEL